MNLQIDATELLDAIRQYRDQIKAVAAVIADDPDNAEALQVLELC